MKLIEKIDPFTIPTAVYKIADDEFTNKLKEICLKENKKHEDMTDKKWNKYNVLDWDYPEIKQLEQYYVEAIENYFTEVIPGFEFPNFSLDGWVNIRKGNSYHMAHTHPGAALILNYYVSCPENSKIIYFNPVVGMTHVKWAIKPTHDINVKPGMLIITPPWILHEVPPSNLDETRISISINVTGIN
jgi:uncharacterized protein (TIGR02466 family)